MSSIANGSTRKLKENVDLITAPGFSLIRNFIALNVPNLTVYNLDSRSGLLP